MVIFLPIWSKMITSLDNFSVFSRAWQRSHALNSHWFIAFLAFVERGSSVLIPAVVIIT